MRISDWSSDVCSSDLRMMARADDSLPRRQQATIRQLAREIDETLAGFLRGQGTVCLSLAVFYAIGLTLAGLEFGLVVGLRSEEHTSELQSLMRISYAVFCLKKHTYMITNTT